MIRAMEFSVPRARRWRSGRRGCGCTWDDRPQPSVDAPVALFFGAGTLYNRDNREYLVKAFPVDVRYERDRVHLALLFPDAVLPVRADRTGRRGRRPMPTCGGRVRHAPFRDPPNHVGYFHATYATIPIPEPGKDLVLLDTRDSGRRRRLVRAASSAPRSSSRTTPMLEHAGRRSAVLLRRQPDAAGPGHRHRGVGRRRRLLGRPQHDPAVRRPSRGRAESRGTRQSLRRTRSSRPTGSCWPT